MVSILQILRWSIIMSEDKCIICGAVGTIGGFPDNVEEPPQQRCSNCGTIWDNAKLLSFTKTTDEIVIQNLNSMQYCIDCANNFNEYNLMKYEPTQDLYICERGHTRLNPMQGFLKYLYQEIRKLQK